MRDSRLELLEADNFTDDIVDDGNDDAYDIEADLAASGPLKSKKAKRGTAAATATPAAGLDKSMTLLRYVRVGCCLTCSVLRTYASPLEGSTTAATMTLFSACD